jgi:hypothetical protein
MMATFSVASTGRGSTPRSRVTFANAMSAERENSSPNAESGKGWSDQGDDDGDDIGK